MSEEIEIREESIEVIEENQPISVPSSENVPNEEELLKGECDIAFEDLQVSADIIEDVILRKDFAAAEAELEDISSCYKKFVNSNEKLLSLVRSDLEKVSIHQERRRKFLILYKSQRNRLMSVKAEKRSQDSSDQKNLANKKQNIKLPKVNIPIFDGKAEKWLPFKNLYTSLIHSSHELDDLTKHNYLRSLLINEPATLIQNLPLSSEDYQAAFEIIIKHYDDPFRQITGHLNSLYNAKSVPNKNSRGALRELIVQFRQHAAGLQTILNENQTIDPLSQCLIHWFLIKSDTNTRTDWEREMAKSKSFSNFTDFIDYMDARCSAFERATEVTVNNEQDSTNRTKKIDKFNKVTLAVTSNKSADKTRICLYCRKNGHYTPTCEEFRNLSPEDRLTFVKKRRLCIFCFRGNCNPNMCSKRPCYKCKGKHNTLLHINKKAESSEFINTSLINYNVNNVNNCVSNGLSTADYLNLRTNSNFSLNIANMSNKSKDSLLATVIIKVSNSNNTKLTEARALLDSGSQINFITDKMARKLDLPFKKSQCMLRAISGLKTKSTEEVSLQIESLHSNFNEIISCSVLNQIVSLLPEQHFSIDHWSIPSHVILADPQFNIPGNIDILLGLNVFWNTLGLNKITLGPNLPILWNSKLGWLVTGNLLLTEQDNLKCFLFIQQAKDELMDSLERFWKIEEIPEKVQLKEEIQCENFFQQTTLRDSNGRFQVRLPFKKSTNLLGESKDLALKRFFYLEKRFSNNHELKKAYVSCMKDYVTQGHMSKVTEENLNKKGFYIPHHAIFKETSSSTKLRVVFDASMKSSSNISLNDLLMVGPVVQPDLFSTIIRFRLKRWVFVADIVKMYRQIRIHHEDSSYQRIFWRESEHEPLLIYELNTVTFGTASAPFLATRCLKKLAEEYSDKFPLAKTVLLSDFYVDDVLSGADSIETALDTQNQLIQLLGSAGFQLSKWCSNSPKLLQKIPLENRETQFPLSLGNSQAVKTLGILWSPIQDTFKIWMHLSEVQSNYTKRQVLSIIASIFDPFGIVGPILIKAKIFMQLLWQANSTIVKKRSLQWDEKLPQELLEIWSNFAKELHLLNDIVIPRYILPKETTDFIEIHGYCDASNKAYGAVLYLRSSGLRGKTCVRLLCSKTRVAPLKQQSLPRLELCGALLLSELVAQVFKILSSDLNINLVRLMTDSTIVLSWINSPASRWQPFVANRVQKIQDNSHNFLWDHVDGKNNPADILSRGIDPNGLKSSSLWWNGPQELSLNNKPYPKEIKFKLNQPLELEARKIKKISLITIVTQNDWFIKYSNFNKLLRMTAWIHRFCINTQKIGPFISGELKIFELQNALNCLIKVAQFHSFPEEMRSLSANIPIANGSPLKNLTPFLDQYGILRVGGRLSYSNLSFEQQHPAILSPKHIFTQLIIKYEHLKHLHAGFQLLNSIIRRKFWILRGKYEIKKCIYKCITCIRFRADALNQLMANLPRSRVIPSKPFSITGVDYTGAVDILERGGPRTRKIIRKAYIAVFVCFTTKAIHLELVSDATTSAFLAALTRFISRRGIPLEIHSDNGTTFVGAKNELLRLKEFLQKSSSQISNFALDQNISWHFIPSGSPHFGGLWEAGVKSVKKHLRTVMFDKQLTFEQLTTILTQIEACLNSRPLFPESHDPNDPNALTPGHFLIGGPILALPNPDLLHTPENRLKHWELVQQVTQKFWKRWSTDYLNTLQQRTKWRIAKDDLKIGDLVLIKELNKSPTKWSMGRVIELHRGLDGHVRVVSLKTKDGQIKRPIVKLIPFPTDIN